MLSERLFMEKNIEHIYWLTTPDNECIEMNTVNTSIYRYLGAKAVYDHLYVDISDTDPGMGLYIWSDAPLYQNLLSMSSQMGVEVHSGLDEVHPLKINKFENRVVESVYFNDLDTIRDLPEEWLQ